MVLDQTTESVSVVLGEAITTANCDVVCYYEDLTTTSYLAGSSDQTTNGTTPVSVVAAPAVSTQRRIKGINIYNADTVTHVVTVQYLDGAATRVIIRATLATLQSLVYANGSWAILPAASLIGPTGALGPQGFRGADGGDGDDAVQGFGISTGQERRDGLAPDAKGWCFLGTATGATVTVGPVVWAGEFQQFMINYRIAGYSGGTPVGRLLLGAGAPSTTGLTNGSTLSEGVTAPTSAPSIPGMPLAVTLSAIAREGWVFVEGPSGSLKNLNCLGQNGNAAVATPPTLYRAAGVFSDLGTNLLLKQAQLTVYDTLIATAVSVNTFLAGARLSVWGRNND